jgi:hypothetical protein
MASVPMTNFIPVERRGQKAAPNLKAMNFEGPQKEYMGSLARLVQGMAILGKSLFPINLHLHFSVIIAKLLAYALRTQCHRARMHAIASFGGLPLGLSPGVTLYKQAYPGLAAYARLHVRHSPEAHVTLVFFTAPSARKQDEISASSLNSLCLLWASACPTPQAICVPE